MTQGVGRRWAVKVDPQSFPFSGSQTKDFGVLQNVIVPSVAITWSRWSLEMLDGNA